MTAPILTLDKGQLDTIINFTGDRQNDMDRLYSEVMALGDTIRQHMDSTAGVTMKNRLDEWTADYRMLRNDLQALNDKVAAMRDALVSSHYNATSAAGGNNH